MDFAPKTLRAGARRLLALTLAGAAAFPGQSPAQPNAPLAGQTTSRLAPVRSCASLRDVQVAADEIGVPDRQTQVKGMKRELENRGARVTSAREARLKGVPFCKVLGEIRSVDPAAQPIRFELNLPGQWNGKAVHYGGGGFDGSLVAANGLHTPEVGIDGTPTPVERGYATFGSDSGHHHHYWFAPDEYNAVKARFALNTEERRNFSRDALKKTHDTVVVLMKTYYGEPPRRMFFLGGSTGGREAYFVTQLWPLDYDGVLGAYAGWNQVELDLQLIRVAQAEYRKGDRLTRGWLPKDKTRLVATRVAQACDAADGLRDGIVSDPDACHFDLHTLACAPGEDHPDCLTPGQMATFETIGSEQRTSMPLNRGVQSIPGYNVTRGTDLTGSMGLFRHPFHDPAFPFGSFYYQVGSGVLRFFLTKDLNFNLFRFDTTTGGSWGRLFAAASLEGDASDADLTPFARHGGKFLIVHGTSDPTIPTGASVQFYRMLQARMGQAAMDKFMRFYLVPGFGHAKGIFDAGFDALGILDQWVETGVAPENVIATDNNRAQHGRTRPMCVYPAWPKYVGGEPNSASSFTCVP